MRKVIILLMSLMMVCLMASCSMSDYTTGESSEEGATVTGSGNEYHATVDQDGEDTVMAELTFPVAEEE